MPKLLVPLIGAGKEGDAFRVDLPSYSLLAIDYKAMQAVVDVPAADLPKAFESERPKTVALESAPIEAVELTRANEPALRAHLAQRYVEPDGSAV